MKNKFKILMEKDGFILFLFLCVCIVAGGTLYISMKNINADPKIISGNGDFVILNDQSLEEETIGANQDESVDEEMAEIEEIIIAEVSEDPGEEMVENLEEETVEVVAENSIEEIEFEEDDEVKDVNVAQDTGLILPVEGAIITEYTSNSLVYSETLESWIGHGAIDIEALEGTIVKSAGDGVIKEIYEDDLWGIVIVIDHGNNLNTKYAGLGTKEMVKVGLNVKRGDHISKIGNTAKIEMLMKPHLHFEVIKNGKLIDPRSINK